MHFLFCGFMLLFTCLGAYSSDYTIKMQAAGSIEQYNEALIILFGDKASEKHKEFCANPTAVFDFLRNLKDGVNGLEKTRPRPAEKIEACKLLMGVYSPESEDEESYQEGDVDDD